MSTGAAAASRGVWLMIVVLTCGTFLATSSGTTRSPFLLDMAQDLGTDLPAVANLVAIMSVSWGIMSLVAGTLSDRVGRKNILVGAVIGVGAAMVGIGTAQTYPVAVFWALAGGIGGGSFMGTVFATVSDHVGPATRGRSLGWVMTGQSLSLVLGVPVATLIGAQIGWRGAHLTFAAATILVGLSILLVVPRRGQFQATAREAAAGAPLQTILRPRILSLLISGTTERVCFAAMSVYQATFLISTYHVSLDVLAGALLLVALGNLFGNMAGGQLADRVASREGMYGLSLVLTGLIVLPLFFWTPHLDVSIALGFAYSFANAVGRPAFMAALSSVPESVRGTVLGLNVTFASVGWLTSTTIGGWLVTGTDYGFASLGVFCAASAFLGTAVLVVGRLLGSRVVLSETPDGKAPVVAR
ncbi:MAG: MFS transporter [Chloroflexi bacterium]|nr:MFS transporter [Chloroflexota bacterium]